MFGVIKNVSFNPSCLVQRAGERLLENRKQIQAQNTSVSCSAENIIRDCKILFLLNMLTIERRRG